MATWAAFHRISTISDSKRSKRICTQEIGIRRLCGNQPLSNSSMTSSFNKMLWLVTFTIWLAHSISFFSISYFFSIGCHTGLGITQQQCRLILLTGCTYNHRKWSLKNRTPTSFNIRIFKCTNALTLQGMQWCCKDFWMTKRVQNSLKTKPRSQYWIEGSTEKDSRTITALQNALFKFSGLQSFQRPVGTL